MNEHVVWVGFAALLLATLLAPKLDERRVVAVVVAIAAAVWTVVAIFEVAD